MGRINKNTQNGLEWNGCGLLVRIDFFALLFFSFFLASDSFFWSFSGVQRAVSKICSVCFLGCFIADGSRDIFFCLHLIFLIYLAIKGSPPPPLFFSSLGPLPYSSILSSIYSMPFGLLLTYFHTSPLTRLFIIVLYVSYILSKWVVGRSSFLCSSNSSACRRVSVGSLHFPTLNPTLGWLASYVAFAVLGIKIAGLVLCRLDVSFFGVLIFYYIQKI